MDWTHPYLSFIYIKAQFIPEIGNSLLKPELNQENRLVRGMVSRVQQAW